MKQTLLKRQWAIEDRIKKHKDEVSRLMDEMYKDPDAALSKIKETAKNNEQGIEAAIETLKDKPKHFGNRRIKYHTINAVEEGKKFRENRKLLTKALRDIEYEQGRLGHIKSGLEEIDRTENQDKVKEPPVPPKEPSENTKEEIRDTPEQFAQKVKAEERLADERAQAYDEVELEQGREERKLKMKKELEAIRASHELERDDELER